MHKKLIFSILLAMVLPLAHAGEAVSIHSDPELEKRVIAVSKHLRCLVCQNEDVANSNSGLAIDLKNQVREKLRQGQSEREILEYMVARYGDFVLFKPLVKSNTWLLWFGPLLLVLLGFAVLAVQLRQRRKMIQQAPVMSAEEHARAAALLSGKHEGDRS